MDSKRTFMILAIVAAASAVMVATPVMAQNMTGGNMTCKISGAVDAECSKSPACIT